MIHAKAYLTRASPEKLTSAIRHGIIIDERSAGTVQEHHHRSHVRRGRGHAAAPGPGRRVAGRDAPDQPYAPPAAALFPGATPWSSRSTTVRTTTASPGVPAVIKASLLRGADQITFSMRPGTAIVDVFNGVELTWRLIARGALSRDGEVFWLSFDGEHKARAGEPLVSDPHVMARAEAMVREQRQPKLYRNEWEVEPGRRDLQPPPLRRVRPRQRSVKSNTELRKLLIQMRNTVHRSILLVEDVDCALETAPRRGDDGVSVESSPASKNREVRLTPASPPCGREKG
jgi:hypothetical protein